MAKYNILVGVKLDSNSLSSLRDKLAKRKDIKVPVSVKVDNASLKAIKKQISDSKIKAVKLNLDTSSAKKKIATIRRQIEQLSNIKINIGGRTLSGSGSGLEIIIKDAEKLSKIYDKLSKFDSKIGNIHSNAGSKQVVKDVEDLRARTEKARNEYKELMNIIKNGGQVSAAAISKLVTEMNELGTDIDSVASRANKANSELKRLNSGYSKIKNAESSLADVRGKSSSNDAIIKALEKEEAELVRLKKSYGGLRAASIRGDVKQASLLKFEKEIARVVARINQLKNIGNISLGLDTGSLEAKVNGIVQKMNKLGGANKDVISSVEAMQASFAKLKGAKSVEEMEAAYKELLITMKQAQSQIKLQDIQQRDARATQQMLLNAKSLELSKQKLALDMDNWLKNNTAAVSKFGGQISGLKQRIQDCDASQLKNLRSEFQLITKQAELSEKATLTAIDKVKAQVKRYASYFLVSSVAFAGVYKIRQMFQNAVDVDTQMTELYRVTDLSTSQYSELYDGLVKSAQEYGAVLTDLIGATADWSRSGFDADTAARLAEITTMYQHIADVDYQEAYENLMTSYKGFEGQIKEEFGNDSAAAVGYIADILNEFDNNYAVTAAGVGEGLKRAASALSVADNTIQETAAMVGGITEVTQDPEKAGNALKVVSMRLRGMKGELEDLGEETDENVENISKMQGQILNLTHGKVNIFDDNGEFKSTYEILQGIANVWEDLNSIEQADLLETISGKHRANDVASLLSNWQNVEKMVISAENATGSARTEYEKYINSLQGHINKLESAFQTLSATTMNKGLLNGAIDGITTFLNILNTLIDKIGVLPVLIGVAFGAFSLKNFMTPFKVATNDITRFSDLFGALTKNISLFGIALRDIGPSLKTFIGNIDFSNIKQSILSGNGISGAKNSGGVFKENSKPALSVLGDKTFNSNLNKDIEALKKFEAYMNDNKGASVRAGIEATMQGASFQAKSFATNMQAAGLSSENFAKSAKLAEIATNAQNGGFKGSIAILNDFKTGMDKFGVDEQKALGALKEFKPALASYISNTDAAKLSTFGYIRALSGAKVATFALQAASMAMNMALTMGISLLITTVISAISSYINRANELADKADEISSKFKEQSESAKGAKSVIDEVGESYERLSKGVNSVTGKNESLSSEEYEEYLKITNQIADAMPSLVSGFDSQGNAILSCRGSLEALNEEYKKMQQAANDSVLGGAGTIFEDFENKVKKASGSNFKDANIWTRLLGFDFDNSFDMESYEALSKTLDATSGSIAESADKYLASVKLFSPTQLTAVGAIIGANIPGAKEYAAMIDNANEIASELEKLGYEKTLTEKLTRDNASFAKRILTETPKAGQDILKAFEATVEPLAEDMRSVAEAHISNAFLSGDYSNISEDMQTMIESMVPNLSYDFFADFIDKDGNFNTTKFYAELNSILSTFNDLEPLKRQKFETFFNLQTEYNNGEVTTGEYFRSIEEINSIISTLDPEVQENIKITMGLDESSINEVQYDYNKLINDLVESGATEDVAKKFADGLTSKEITTAINLVASNEIDIKNLDINQFKKKVQELTELDEAISFELDIDIRTEELDKLKDAVAESVSGSGLSTESISVVEQTFGWMDTYDPSKLFERTANGLRLNTDELKKMNAEYKEYNSNGLEDKLGALATKYNKTKSDLANLTYGTDEYYSKLNELDSIESQINATEQLAAQYEGLTSAYNEWLLAEEAGSQRDMYEKVIEGFENVEDEISRGWYDDATVEFIEMLSGKDLSSGNINKIKSAWKGLGKTIEGTSYSVKDFFTVNDDGDSTNAGVYNFLEAVDAKFDKKGIIKKDGSGNIIGFDFKVAGGDEAIAEALGVSEELVQIMVRAADDAGFVVSMDGTYQQLDVLKEKAEEAAKTLKEMFKGTENEITTNFNLDTDNEQDLKAQYDSALAIWSKFKEIKNEDGTVNMNVAGAEEAFTLVSTLQTMLDQLSEPVYMDVEVSEVSKELQEPLSQLQEYERLTQQEHQLNLKGTDTSSLQESKNEIIDYLEGLDPTIKANLGIEGLSKDELQKKVEAGEVKIPATIDLQVETNNTLRDMINVSLYNSGLITKEELEKRVDVNVYADKIDTTSAEQQTNEAVENSVSQTTEVDKNADVNVDAGSVNTTQAEQTINEAVDDSAKNIQNVETEVDANVNVETVSASVDEVESATEELASNIEKIEDKDVTINVTVKGLDEVKELNKNIDLATNIEGDIDNLSEFVNGAKALSKLDDKITTNVTANVGGNVIDEFEYKLDNLKVFADSAKGLKSIGEIRSNVTANVNGNVIDEFEYKLDNLKVFSDSSKELKNIGSFTSNITANVEGNVIDKFEYKINNLKVFSDSAKDLKSIGVIETKVTANVEGNVTEKFEYKIDNLKAFTNSAKDLRTIGVVESKVTANIEGNVTEKFEYKIDNLKAFVDNAKDIGSIGSDTKAKITADVEGNVIDTFEYKINNLKVFADSAKDIHSIGEDTKAKITANIEGNVKDTFEYQINNLKAFTDSAKDISSIGEDTKAKITADIEGNVKDTFEYQINNLKTFVSSAKDISSIGSDTKAKITADIEGNIKDTFEYQINNLKTFTDSAKDIHDIGSDTKAKITADVEGNVVDTYEYKINNIKTFIDSAKDIKSIGSDTKAKITADVEGNVIDTYEYKINNLRTFIDSAKGIKGIGSDTKAKITADVYGNVIDTYEYKINNLRTFIDSAKGIKGIGSDTKAKITADVEGNVKNTPEYMINNLKTFIDSAKGIKGIGEDTKAKITADIEGDVISTPEYMIDNLRKFIDSAQGIKSIGSDTKAKITADIEGNIGEKTTSINNLSSFASAAKALQGVSSKDITITANIQGGITNENISTLSYFGSVVSNLPEPKTVTVTTSVDAAGIASAQSSLQSLSDSGVMHDYESTVTVNVNPVPTTTDLGGDFTGSGTIDMVAATKNMGDDFFGKGTVSVSADKNLGSGFHGTGTITVTGISLGTSNIPFIHEANGTAHANGNAFAQGNWGVKGSGVALGGELGQELVVRNGRWFTIGDNGAEFFKYQPNDIIFNAGQTKQLFEQGKIVNGRTRGMVANANGTAFAEGNVFAKGKKNSNAEIAWEMEKARTWFDGITDAQVKKLGYKNIKTVKQFYKAIENGTINPKFGNINMDNREVIRWNKTNKEKYKDGLKSWGHYYEVDSGAYDTVYGATTRYGEYINGKGVQVAYSPIVVDENGKASKFLTTDEVDNYINKIVRKAYEQDGKFKQSTILSLDNLGIIAGTDTSMNYGQNGTGNTAVIKSALMHFAGKYGAIQQAKNAGKKKNKKAKYDGSAFAYGTLKDKDTEPALGGEVGTEILVRDGRWYTIGDDGAEFFGHKKNDIIFNAEQSKQLLENGKISSGNRRGYITNANGTAFASGRAFYPGTGSVGTGGGGKVGGGYYKPSSSSSSKSKSGSSSADDFKETIDWIEVAIERIERKISNLDKKASNVYKSWTSRNTNLKKEIEEINNEIGLQKQARDYYKKSADKFDLKKKYKDKVKNGTIQIEDIKDKDLAEDIKTYQELWEKYLAAKDEIEALQETEHAKYSEIFDNVASDYEGLITLQEHYKNILEESISQQEAQGHIVSEKYYENLINYEQSNQKQLLAERSDLVNAYNEAIANGMSKSSETARNMRAKINEVTQAIYASKTAVLEYQKAMREVKLEGFELIQSQISQITQEADFLIELMSNDKLYDDKGQLTDKGNATRGLHVQNYETYMQQAAEYTRQIEELKKLYDGNTDSTDYINDYNNLVKSRQDAILSAEKEKDAIKDLVEEGINKELDSLQKLIDKKQEALDSEKD